jgi:hypothetical protein
MKKSALLKRFPRANQGFLALGIDGTDHGAGDPGPAAELERSAEHGVSRPRKLEGRHSEFFLVRVTAVRKRLLDDDNACEKYHVDCLRYAGVIHSDARSTTRIKTAQRRCAEGESEKVIVEVFGCSKEEFTKLCQLTPDALL